MAMVLVGDWARSALAMNRIASGDQPSMKQWPVGAATRELAQHGLLTNLDDLAGAGKGTPTIARGCFIHSQESPLCRGVPD